MINIALYKPDIPQNTAAIVRLSACLNLRIHIIEPCGFNLDDSRFKRVAMDYVKLSEITRYSDFEDFKNKNNKSRIILLTTKAKKFYHEFKFKKNDFLLFGRESAVGFGCSLSSELLHANEHVRYLFCRAVHDLNHRNCVVSIAYAHIEPCNICSHSAGYCVTRSVVSGRIYPETG